MARSWERMVQRNSQQLNKQRKKQGKDAIHSANSTTKTSDVFKGRNIVLPVALVALGVLYWIIGTLDQSGGSVFMHWLGVGLYLLLAVMLYFRRPFLKVERNRLSTIKFNRERWLPATDIEKITVSRSAVTIKYKGKRTTWMFSKLINRYDTAAMGERLQEFGKVNNIPVEQL
ncbi:MULTISPECIES: hypothetical protein [unclassified Paenibacillus]|uniref:hypothetical protein n=1 Tax=unclassified Paenibacillus TaxID=185978 RepID=UPI0036A5E97F